MCQKRQFELGDKTYSVVYPYFCEYQICNFSDLLALLVLCGLVVAYSFDPGSQVYAVDTSV